MTDIYLFCAGKRARLLVDESEDDYGMEEVPAVQVDCTFDDLCSDAVFPKEENIGSEVESMSWGLLDSNVLARVFHVLRTDVKSLLYAALTCKHWRAVCKFYKDMSRQVDLSSVGSSCTDAMIRNIMVDYPFLILLSFKFILCWLRAFFFFVG